MLTAPSVTHSQTLLSSAAHFLSVPPSNCISLSLSLPVQIFHTRMTIFPLNVTSRLISSLTLPLLLHKSHPSSHNTDCHLICSHETRPAAELTRKQHSTRQAKPSRNQPVGALREMRDQNKTNKSAASLSFSLTTVFKLCLHHHRLSAFKEPLRGKKKWHWQCLTCWSSSKEWKKSALQPFIVLLQPHRSHDTL